MKHILFIQITWFCHTFVRGRSIFQATRNKHYVCKCHSFLRICFLAGSLSEMFLLILIVLTTNKIPPLCKTTLLHFLMGRWIFMRVLLHLFSTRSQSQIRFKTMFYILDHRAYLVYFCQYLFSIIWFWHKLIAFFIVEFEFWD